MTISRRGFIGGLAAGTLAAGSAHAAATKRFKGYPGRLGLLHDTTLCVGCRSCEMACQEVNHLPLDQAPIGDQKIFDTSRGVSDKLYTVVNRYRPASGQGTGGPRAAAGGVAALSSGPPGPEPAVFRKHQCMHCNEPCCASVCFVKAFTKTPEGPVLYDPEVCVGCRYCVFACPYYALSYEYGDPLTPRVVRCTMCYPRIKEGKIPACTEACPTGAIRFGKREELLQLARERMRKYPGRYHPEIFGENEYGGTSWLTLLALPPQHMGLPEDLPYEPLPNLTTGFLSLAPLVAAIFPGLLAGFNAFTRRREKIAREELDAQLRQQGDSLRQESAEKMEQLRRNLFQLLEQAHQKVAADKPAAAAEKPQEEKR